MSATIYIKSNGDDDLTPEQLELLHHYSDQARVWAYLLLKEAGLFVEGESKDELQKRLDKSRAEWRSLRDEWQQQLKDLAAIDPEYATAVDAALKKQYQEKKPVAETILPPAPEGADASAAALAEKVKKSYTKLYPTRTEIGHSGPYLTPEESAEMFNPPDIEGLSEEDADAKIKAWEEKTGLDIAKWKQSGMSPIIDMARGFATNQGVQIIDPESGATVFDPSTRSFNEDLMFDFAHEVLARALKSYNPFKAEDTGGGFEGRKASFGTYLYRTMVNEIKSRKEKYVRNLGVKDVLPADADVPYILNALISQGITPEDLKAKVDEAELVEDSPIKEWRAFYDQFQTNKKFRTNTVPLSLNQPTGDEESSTIEEALAEKGREEGWATGLEDSFREWLAARMKKPGSKLTPELAERLVYVYHQFFVEGDSLSEIARNIPTEKGKKGLYSSRPRPKEIAFLKKHKVDVSSLPATLPPYASQAEDSEKRSRMVVELFKQLAEKAKNDPAAEKVLADARKEYEEMIQPNAARIRNLIHGPHPSQTSGNTASIMAFLLTHPDIASEWEQIKQKKKQSALEEFLTSISTLRKEGGLNYNLLRNKIVQKLSEINPQLFVVYTYLYESTFSNPDTARMMKLSPPRITGLKKKIVSTLLELPEIQSFFEESEYDSISPLRRFIYNEGDTVKVQSINEVGTIETTSSNNWFKVHLNNGNDVFTVKEDIQKHSTLLDSAQNVLSHYFGREVVTPQCYLSFISTPKPQLAILELRPSSEVKTTARLHVNNNLIEITEFTEQYPDNLISILKGHLGVNASMDTPFTPLFEEVE